MTHTLPVDDFERGGFGTGCLGVSSQSVRRHIRDGRLKHVRVGHLVRLRPLDVLSFVDPATVSDKRVKGPRETVS